MGQNFENFKLTILCIVTAVCVALFFRVGDLERKMLHVEKALHQKTTSGN